MRSNEANVDDAERVVHCDDKPVIVPADIKHNTIVGEDAGRCIGLSNVIWTIPLSLFDVMIPGFEWVVVSPKLMRA